MKYSRNYIARGTGLFTIIISIIVIIGILFNIPSFKSPLPGIGSMKFNTAVCFILSGAVLFLLDLRGNTSLAKSIVLVASSIIFLIGLLSFSQYLFHRNLGIDQLLLKEVREEMANDFPGRMSLFSSINFLLLGIIFLMLQWKKYPWLIQALLISILPGSLGVIINNLYGISFLNLVPLLENTDIIPAVLFIVLMIGIFYGPIPKYESFSLLKKIVVFFVSILLVRGIIFFAINKSNEQTANMYKWVEHTHNEILQMAEQINSQFNEIQNRTSSYIISGDEHGLPDLINLEDSLVKNTNRLEALTNDDAVQQQRINTLQNHLKTNIAFINELIKVRKNAGFPGAQRLLLDSNGRGKLFLNTGRPIIEDMEQRENQRLAIRKAANDLSNQNSSRLFTLFQVITVALMLIALVIIRNNTILRNKTEDTLQKSLKEISDYKYALDESSIVAITDPKGVIKHVNDNFCKISKYKREELISRDHRIINSGFHPKEYIRDLWITIGNGKIWRGDLKNKAIDGSFYWVDTTIVPFLDKHGKPYQYVAIQKDVTQRKILENEIDLFNQTLQKNVTEKTKEVIEKEKQYRFLLHNMREGIQVIGYDWKYLIANNAALQQFKYSNEDLQALFIMDKYPFKENKEIFNVLERCMKDRKPEIIENEFIFPGGTKTWLELSIQPVPEGLFILSADITKRKKAEQKLKESEHFLNETQAVSKIGSYVLDFGTGIWKSSDELENIFGITEDYEHTINGWLSLIHPDHQKMMEEYFTQEVVGKNGSFDKEYKIINKITRQERWVHGIGDLEFDQGGDIAKMLGTIQDITERKKINELIRSSNERFKLVDKATFDTFWDWNYSTKSGQWGEGIIKIFGYTNEKLKYDETWVDEFLHPGDRKRILGMIQNATDAGLENWQDEYRFKCADGSFKEVFGRGSILFDENKKPYRMIGAMTDVTERKRLEKELYRQQLKQQQLITEITIEAQEKQRIELGRELHDNISQVLATVKMYLEIIKKGQHLPADDLISKSYEYINDAMKEIRKLSHSLVLPSFEDLDLKEALQELVNDTNLINNTKVQLVFDDRYHKQMMDKNKELMLYRIVQEQLNNINKYAKAKDAIITLILEDGGIFLSVADNGQGFDVSKKAKGIGLKNINSRVEFYSGTMNILSEPGKGCTLEVYIPFTGKALPI